MDVESTTESPAVEACASIEVLASTYDDTGLRTLMLAAIERADIIAIDTEFTGLAADDAWTPAFNDSIAR